MLDCFLNYSVNPNLRFHSRIDKIIDDVIREKINIPHKFRMRLESRHCIESRIIYFRFRVLDKSCLQCNVWDAVATKSFWLCSIRSVGANDFFSR